MNVDNSGTASCVLKLYVAGGSARSRRAVENFERIRERVNGCDCEVVDILEAPQAAEDNKILATPLLIKHSPEPVCKVIGDLSEWERVIEIMELENHAPGAGGPA